MVRFVKGGNRPAQLMDDDRIIMIAERFESSPISSTVAILQTGTIP
jgi:hypothetical protein